MRRYETICILRPSMNEDEINTTIDNSNAIITGDKGQIIEIDRWGMRKLAYPIKKELQGFYVFCDYSGTPEAVAEMERKFRIDDAVLRYMTIKTADSISTDEINEATEQAATKQAQAAKEIEAELEDVQQTESVDEASDKEVVADEAPVDEASNKEVVADEAPVDEETTDSEEK